MKTVVATLLLFSFLFGGNLENLKRGINAFLNKDYKTALRYLPKEAEDGNVVAQSALGTMYLNGLGVEPDCKKAEKWLAPAAAHGSKAAQFALDFIKSGQKCEKRNIMDVPKSSKKKLALIREAGFLYLTGKGVEENPEKGAKFIKIAALGGDAKAQYVLGMLYESGMGVERNENNAFKWYKRAAENNQTDAQARIGFYYLTGKGGAEEDYLKAAKWLKLAAKKGNKDAQYFLGAMYSHGMGVGQDIFEAEKLWKHAAQQGDVASAYSLGDLYYKRKEYKSALKWLKTAAEKGDNDAKDELAYMYYNGWGTDENMDKGCRLWREVAESGDDNAQDARSKYERFCKDNE
jgi:TPR repeat protein